MPLLNLQQFGINLDGWILAQSGEQPYKRAARCHAFQKEFIECADGIGQIRAQKECRVELEDFYECMHREKTHERLHAIRNQRDKLIKEGKYTPPAHHTGQADQTP